MRLTYRRWWWLLLLPALALGWYVRQRLTPRSVVVFVSGDHHYSSICRMNADGTGRRTLLVATPYPQETCYEEPAVSPDGKRIVYVRITNGERQLWVADINGEHQSFVTPCGRSYDLYPSFFPDGRSFVYCALSHDDKGRSYNRLYRINIDGTGKRQLTFGKRYDLTPVVSPDGKSIIYASYGAIRRGGKGGIYRLDLDSGRDTRLTTHLVARPSVGSPTISPDGKWIAFVAYRRDDYAGDIFLMDSHGGHLRRLTHEAAIGGSPTFTPLGKRVGHPTFSPDGKRIAYCVFESRDGMVYYSDICVINRDGRGRKMLTNYRQKFALCERLPYNPKLWNWLSNRLHLGDDTDTDPAWATVE